MRNGILGKKTGRVVILPVDRARRYHSRKLTDEMREEVKQSIRKRVSEYAHFFDLGREDALREIFPEVFSPVGRKV